MDTEYKQSADFILKKLTRCPAIAVILGSGLGNLTEEMQEKTEIMYRDIPNFPVSTAPSHTGKLVAGMLDGVNIIAMSGRFHYYEGYSQKELTDYVRVLKQIGIELLILTNAAGGINETYQAGGLMLIADHINFTGLSPLRGANDAAFGPRFADMTDVYTKKLRERVKQSAKKCGIALEEGVYAYMTGPNYETPSEIRALRTLGADAVGMSTVPEAIVAAHAGMRVIGISCITNPAAGISGVSLSEQEVIMNAQKANAQFSQLIRGIISDLERGEGT